MTVFFYKGKYYKYQGGLQIFKTWDFSLNDFELLDFPIWGNDYMQLIFVLAICLVIILLVLFVRLFNQSVKKKIEIAQLKVLKTKTMNQAFTETETSLIQLLLNASNTKRKEDDKRFFEYFIVPSEVKAIQKLIEKN